MSSIGIFDSGIGGLTVVKAIQQRLPDEHIIYVADSAYTPYGNKTAEFVQQRARYITQRLVDKGVKAIVVACNTATAMAADLLRKEFALPIVAMEPAIKPAARLTRSGTVAVLATTGTLSSKRYAGLRDEHGQQVNVLEKYCDQWVGLVEKGDFDSEAVYSQVARDITPLLEAGADTLVLGCTHFPFLSAVIAKVAGEHVNVVNPAPAVASQLARRLQLADFGSSDTSAKLQLFTSGDVLSQQHLIEKIIDKDIMVSALS